MWVTPIEAPSGPKVDSADDRRYWWSNPLFRRMTQSIDQAPSRLKARLEALSEEHQRGTLRFYRRVEEFTEAGLLNKDQAAIVTEHLFRLGERGRNPANTGNIEDLFCHTLLDTKDPVRAYAQALADSVKVVPMEPSGRLYPVLRRLDGTKVYQTVAELDHLSAGDKMLVSHTMVAYGDSEMWASAAKLVAITHPKLKDKRVEREVIKMAVQSQHLPSSSFVLARASGLTVDCGEIYGAAGYDELQIERAQRFYDTCGEFAPHWAADFVEGRIPTDPAWHDWRRRYLELRGHLPEELVYQLASDTLTNFLDGTLESGKWTDASVFFGGVTQPADVPKAIARIVNQYIAEHVALHDRPASELTVACAETLRPWGIGFVNDRATVQSDAPEKAELLRAQFEAAWSRKNR